MDENPFLFGCFYVDKISLKKINSIILLIFN